MPSIYRTLLERGYFPKELPPAFHTEQFAKFACTSVGRNLLATHKPAGNFTECVRHDLALAGGVRRPLDIPHPHSYARLASEIAKHFRRLLRKAAAGHITRSRPIFAHHEGRAIKPSTSHQSLASERMKTRRAARFLLRMDVSQFYPSLYTHAVGWAIDPKLRERAHWKNKRFLGQRIDQALMDLQGKESHGIPIGNDVSFLLAEIVLAQVDREAQLPRGRSFRWYDDYEIACHTMDEAERLKATLSTALDRFRLRENPIKTTISPLPSATRPAWQPSIAAASAEPLGDAQNMTRFFDTVFSLWAENPGEAVLGYALATLFRVTKPSTPGGGAVAEAAISQAILSEPGCSQKAFALLSFWAANGYAFEHNLIQETVVQMIRRHDSVGVTSDVSWALSFCIEHGLKLPATVRQFLEPCEDVVVLLQGLHLNQLGLVSGGLRTSNIEKRAAKMDPEGPHWLLLYEAHRHRFLRRPSAVVQADAFFSALDQHDVGFYQSTLPAYASVIAPGGAPDWVVRTWLKAILQPPGADEAEPIPTFDSPVAQLVRRDAGRLNVRVGTLPNLLAFLQGRLTADELQQLMAEESTLY